MRAGVLMMLLVGAAQLGAQGEAARFRDLPLNARGAAMGGSLIAANGLSSLDANPAAAAGIAGVSAGASHMALPGGIFLEGLDLAFPAGAMAFSLDAALLQADEIPRIDATGKENGSFRSQESWFGAGTAGTWGPMAAGVRGGLLMRQYGDYSSTGGSFDLGLQGSLPWGLRAGLAWMNVGILGALAEASDALPGRIGGGLAWTYASPHGETVELQASATRGAYGEVYGGVGAELGLAKAAFLRAGVDLLRPAGARLPFSAGVGGRVGSFALDAAWLPYGDLGQTYLVTASYAPTAASAPSGDNLAPWALSVEESESGVQLRWKAPAGGRMASYRLYARNIADGSLRSLSPRPITTTSVRFKRFQPGSRYLLSVSAVGEDGREGPLSKELLFEPK